MAVAVAGRTREPDAQRRNRYARRAVLKTAQAKSHAVVIIPSTNMGSFLSAKPRHSFDPIKDLPDLSGKVIIVTGGK